MEVNPGLQSATSQGFRPRSTVSWVMAKPKQMLFPVQPSNTQSPAVLWATKPPPKIPPPSSPEGPAVSVDSTEKVPPPLDPQFPPVPWVTLPPRRFITPSPQNLAIPWVTDSPKILTASPPKPELKLPASPSAQKPPVSWIGYPPKKSSSISEERAVPQVAASLINVPAVSSNPLVAEFPEKALPASLPLNPQGPAQSWLVSTYNPQVHQSVSDIINKKPAEGSSAHSEPSHQFPHAFHAEGHDETENLHSGLPHHTHIGPMFQGGQLNNFAALFENGNSERETEDEDFVPVYPYDDVELTVPFNSVGGMLPPPVYMGPNVPNLFYYFLTGQLPHGTVSHTQTDYEAGGDHTTDFGYEDYHTDDLPQIQVPTEQL